MADPITQIIERVRATAPIQHFGPQCATAYTIPASTLDEIEAAARTLQAAGQAEQPAQQTDLHAAHHHETWWLLESTVAPRPFYYAGPRRERRARGEWTDDPNKVVRFPTEDAAKLTIAHMVGADTSKPAWPLSLLNSGWKATEHIFDYTPARHAAAELAASPQQPAQQAPQEEKNS